MAKKKLQDAQEITKEEIRPGMVIKLYERIRDVSAQGKEKERTQFFEGLVISQRGSKENKSITLRKISNGVGVEKIYPLNLPAIEKIELLKQYRVKRAKLFFTRHSNKKLKEVKLKEDNKAD